MRKALTAVLLGVISFSLIGCTQNEEEDLFAKKEQCKTYLNIMEEKVLYQNDLGNHPTEPIVFYSPLRDSCIGAYTVMMTITTDRVQTFHMFDLLTNEHIYNENSVGGDGMEGWNNYDAKKAELKGDSIE